MTAETAPAAHPISPALIQELAAAVRGTGEQVTTIAPASGAELAQIRRSTATDVEEAFAIARAAQARWATQAPSVRAQPFVRFHDRVLTDATVLDLIQAETGKARASAFEEVLDAAGVSLYYGRRAAKFLGRHRRSGAVPFATRTTELRQAKGVVAIISPWNAPLALGVADIIPALLAGNAVVHKPDSATALTALYARRVLIAAGLDKDLWQIVVGGRAEVSAPLLESADHVCFTGSTSAGRAIGRVAADRLISCTLELGGKNPMIVLDDADVAKAAKGAVRACFGHGGQLCIAIERLYIADKSYDEFVGAFVAHAEALKLGTTFDFSYDIGSLANASQLETVQRHVTDAAAKGARVLSGGKARPDIGPYYFEPTILADVTPAMKVYASETFGPVVSVYRYDGDAHAIELANATEYGLNASIWTRDVRRGNRIAAQIRSGTVNINEGYGSAYASVDAPMGGMKASGLGRRHGEHGLVEYTELQTVSSQRLIGFDPLPFLDARQNTQFLTCTYQLMKALRLK